MVEKILNNIHWLGHDGFRIDAVKTLYFDPYQISGQVPADIICVSHEHFDHCSANDIKKIQHPGTVIVTNSASAAALDGDVRVVTPGDTITFEGIEIEAVPSYNVNKDFHPKASGMLGFVVTVEGTRIYHAGDADFIPEMKDVKADVALLPVSGTYVMTAEEAVQAALEIQPQVAIPMHFGSIVGSEDDAQRFAESLKGSIKVVILPKE